MVGPLLMFIVAFPNTSSNRSIVYISLSPLAQVLGLGRAVRGVELRRYCSTVGQTTRSGEKLVWPIGPVTPGWGWVFSS